MSTGSPAGRSGGRLSDEVYDSLLGQLMSSQRSSIWPWPSPRAVVAAITARDPDAAAYAMRRHILRSGDRFRRLFDEGKAADGIAAQA
ncbi:hypothetical protein AB0J82_22485 [Asanoa sp. NPDC049518]|uniref:hypothetical protein n=1 Tax=unclassified Asanoa TaxID=2685164 RepID=UPI00343F69C9